MDDPKEILQRHHAAYQALKTTGLDIIRSIHKYFENTDSIQELSYSKVLLNFTVLDVPLTVSIEFPVGSLTKKSGVITTFYKSEFNDNHVALEKEFVFDHLGNIENAYTKDDFPSIYLKFTLDYIVKKIKITPKA
jgi:hypothetical protein